MMRIKNITQFYAIFPGVTVCVMTGLIAIQLGALIPSIGSATLAILFGLLLGNTIFTQPKLLAGVHFSESNLLNYSIVLLGGTLSYQVIFQLGLSGVLFIALQMMVTLACVEWLGKRLGFESNFRLLMAAGNAVCGSSAIAASAPVIDASERDKSITITLVNLTGTILMLVLPLLTQLLYQQDLRQTSALMGGILQSVGQVVGSASMVSEEVKDMAMIFKIVRVIFLVFVILYFTRIKAIEKETTEALTHKKSKTRIQIPWYVTGFFIMSLLFTLQLITPSLSLLFKLISQYLEIFALVGIGMSVKFKDLKTQGLKSGLYCVCIGLSQLLCAICLIAILF